MRILKYMFLLLILSFIGTAVFITTQNGFFDVSRSRVIKIPRNIVFDYVNDYKNWETFGSWLVDDSQMTFDYPTKTMGIGGAYSWHGDTGDGSMKTVAAKEPLSIQQKVTTDGYSSMVYWSFKDTVGGTKVTWRNTGKMNFLYKVTSFFNGGITHQLGVTYEKSLANLDKTLRYEMKTYSVKVNGIVSRNSGFYLKKTVTCQATSVAKNIRILIPQMVYFFKKNSLPIIGKPFVIYDNYTTANSIVTLSVCMLVQEKVTIAADSDVSSGELLSFTSLKTTLKGDYSHSKEAWATAKKYLLATSLKENIAGHYIEVYSKTIDDVKAPSKWITEIYIPVFPKAVPPQTNLVASTGVVSEAVTPTPVAQEIP